MYRSTYNSKVQELQNYQTFHWFTNISNTLFCHSPRKDTDKQDHVRRMWCRGQETTSFEEMLRKGGMLKEEKDQEKTGCLINTQRALTQEEDFYCDAQEGQTKINNVIFTEANLSQ